MKERKSVLELRASPVVTRVSLYMYEALPSIADICLRNKSLKQT